MTMTTPASRKVHLGYRKRAAFKRFHKRTQRWACIVAHRRAGKTVAAVCDLVDRALLCETPAPQFAYIAPYANQAKDVAWAYLKQYTVKDPRTVVRESDLSVQLHTGARIRLYGADNPDRLRGLYLDGVVLDEFADMAPGAWSQVIRPTLTDRGGWAAFIGTPKGRNEFWRLYERAVADPKHWYSLRLRASNTGIIPPGELEALRRELSEDEYAREFETSFEAAVRGAYYAALLNAAEAQGRIGRVAADPLLPVHAAFDLGIGDATAIWLAQFTGREIRLIDYIENSGVGLDWYGRALKERGHLYAPLILPHDAQVRELSSGKTRVAMLQAMGFATQVLPLSGVEDGIETVRRYLPRTWIDGEKCAAGLEAVRLYQARMDDKRGLSLGPLHNWTSHAADALRYLMVAYEEPAQARPKVERRVAVGGWMG
jgi:phage terminase large subunit